MKKLILYIFATVGVVSTILFILDLAEINLWPAHETEIGRIESNHSEYDAVLTDTSFAGFGSPIVKIYIVKKGIPFKQGIKLFRFPVFENEYVKGNDLYWNDDGNLVINNRQHRISIFENEWYDPRNDFKNTKQESWKGVKVILKTDTTEEQAH